MFKNSVFYQDAEPTARAIGDQWITDAGAVKVCYKLAPQLWRLVGSDADSEATVTSDEIGAGAVVPSKLGVTVLNETGSTIDADKLVALVGFDVTTGLPNVVLADADVAAHDDLYVTVAAILNEAQGVVVKSALSAAGLNTNSATTAGDPVYLSATAGAFSHTAPSTSNSRVHPVGWVVVKSATVGQIRWAIGPARKIGSDELQSQINTGTHVANVAANNLIGGVPVEHIFTIADQASGNLDFAITHKTRLTDAWFIKGAAGHASEDTIKLQNVTTDMTEALAMGASANALKRFATLITAQTTIAAGANLRIVLVKGAGGGNNTEGVLHVRGVRVA